MSWFARATIVLVAPALAVGGCETPQHPPVPSPRATIAPTPSPSVTPQIWVANTGSRSLSFISIPPVNPLTAAKRCGAPLPFAPTWRPRSWLRKLQPGEGGGGGGAFPGLIGHYGARSSIPIRRRVAPGFVDLTVGPMYAQGFSKPIRVLGGDATLGLIHEGFSVEFRYRGCDYVLSAFGVNKPRLRRFAEHLEPRE